jgi:hypothetical protein
MWQLQNNTPFAVERGWARDHNGGEVWIVIVKGTYSVGLDGSVSLAEEQPPIKLDPEYAGEPGKSSLLYDSDLVITKQTSDVMVIGNAYAPDNRPALETNISVSVGTLSKTLRVTGDRVWTDSLLGGGITDPEPFLTMPVTYERAFGGTRELDSGGFIWEPRNPVGTGFPARVSHRDGERVPNIEDPNCLLASGNRSPRPAGLGPIAREWSPRRERAGSYDDHWLENRYPLVPVDFSDAFYQCAPDDMQCPTFLRGGERVELENLSPGGLMQFEVPRVWLTFSTEIGNDLIEHRSRIHTLILEPNARSFSLVWQTSLPCHGRDHKLHGTEIEEKVYLDL